LKTKYNYGQWLTQNTKQRAGKGQEGMFVFRRERLENALWGAGGSLRGLFRNQGVLGFSRMRTQNPHFMPVVTEFFSAVQARDIGTRALRRRVTTGTGAHRNRKTVASVPAAKYGVDQLRKHRVTSTEQKRQQWLIPFAGILE
jgi:hypothetical protein